MPINNYDDPITPLPVREPSDVAIEIRQRLIQDGVIPAQGPAPQEVEQAAPEPVQQPAAAPASPKAKPVKKKTPAAKKAKAAR